MKYIVFGLACFLALNAQALEPHLGKGPREVTVEIKLTCPMSEELTEFMKSIPQTSEDSTSLDEWQTSFANSMTKLIQLVKSGKMESSLWTADTVSSDKAGQKKSGPSFFWKEIPPQLIA